jgi:ATP-binding cassette, subfamily B, multidrug efflux pump
MAAGSYSRLRKLLGYLRPHRRQAWLGVLALLLVNMLGVYIPLLIRDCIDDIQDGLSYSEIFYYAGLILGLATVMWVIRMASRLWIFGIGRRVEFDLKQRLFDHLLQLEPAYFSRNSIGDLINRATSDLDNIRRLLGFAVLSLVNTTFAYGLTLPFMLAIDVKLSLLAIAVYPLMLLMVQLFSDRLRVEQQDVQEQLSDLSQLIQEDLSGIALLKIYAQEANERQAFAGLNRQLLQVNLRLAKTRNSLFPLLEGLASVSLLVLLWFGSSNLASGRLSVGDFIALIIYVERLVFPTALLGFTITTYQRGEVSVDRVESILSVEPQIKDAPDCVALHPTEIQGWIKADGLSYTYPGGDRPALRGVSFSIQPGELVAVVGPIGSGKSTLAQALPRLIELPRNQLFLDGIDVERIPLTTLRQAVAMVPQDSFLFSTTIRDNIRYGDPFADQRVVEAAAYQAQIHDEIQNFPRQYDTLVGERGITLSGGQRQRTALSRAFLTETPVLILDDALASVDNRTATAILQQLAGSARQRTVLFVTHQLSAAAIADRILVLNEGQLVQSGTHTDLLAQPGLYRQLWEQQQLEQVLR